jgi:hypothetical protein
VNPDLDAMGFMYWQGRFDRIAIHFDPDGSVVDIID